MVLPGLVRGWMVAALLFVVAAAASAQTVYITKTGEKYHVSGCRLLSRSQIPIQLEDAVARGYTPCNVCHPPSSVRLSPTAPVLVQPAPEYVLIGPVVSVHDGDTLTLLVGRTQHRIRLNGIDAPELGQSFSRRSRDYLSELCFGRSVRVRVVDVDRYGREVGDIYLGELLVNAELVRVGLAWHYKEYSDDPHLAALEAAARSKRVGLWSEPSPTAPWDHRRR